MRGDTGDHSGVSGVIDMHQMIADLNSERHSRSRHAHKHDHEDNHEHKHEQKKSKCEDNESDVPFAELSKAIGTISYNDDIDNTNGVGTWKSATGFFVNYEGKKYFLTSSSFVDAYNNHLGKDVVNSDKQGDQSQNNMMGKIIVTVRGQGESIRNLIGAVTFNAPRMDVCMIEFPGQSLESVGAFNLCECSPQVGMNAHVIGYQYASMNGYLSGHVSAINVNRDIGDAGDNTRQFSLENRMILSIAGNDSGPIGAPIIHLNSEGEWVVLGMCYQENVNITGADPAINENFMSGTSSKYLESFLMRALAEKEALPREEVLIKFSPGTDADPSTIKLCPLNHKNPDREDGCYLIENLDPEEELCDGGDGNFGENGDCDCKQGEKLFRLPRDYYLLTTEDNESFTLQIKDMYNQYSAEWIPLYTYNEELEEPIPGSGFRDLLRTDPGMMKQAEKVVTLALYSNKVTDADKPTVSAFNENNKLNTNQLRINQDDDLAVAQGPITTAFQNVQVGSLTLQGLLDLVEATVGDKNCGCDYDVCKLQDAVVKFMNKYDKYDSSNPANQIDDITTFTKTADNTLDDSFATANNPLLVNAMAAAAGELNNGWGYDALLTKCLNMGSRSKYEIDLGDDYKHFLNLVGFRINMTNNKVKKDMEISALLDAIGVKVYIGEMNKHGQCFENSEGWDQLKLEVLQHVYTFEDHSVMVVEQTNKKLVLKVQFCQGRNKTVTFQVDETCDTEIIFNKLGKCQKETKQWTAPSSASLSDKVFVCPSKKGALVLTVNTLTNKDDSTIAMENSSSVELDRVIYKNKIAKVEYVKYEQEGAEELAFYTGSCPQGLIKMVWTGVTDSDIYTDGEVRDLSVIMSGVPGAPGVLGGQGNYSITSNDSILRDLEDKDFCKLGFEWTEAVAGAAGTLKVVDANGGNAQTILTLTAGSNNPSVVILGQKPDTQNPGSFETLESKIIESDVAAPDTNNNDRDLVFCPYYQIPEIVTGARYENIDGKLHQYTRAAFMVGDGMVEDKAALGGLEGVEFKSNGVLSRHADRRLFGALPTDRRLFGALPRGRITVTNLSNGNRLKKSKFDESIWDTLVNDPNGAREPKDLIWTGLMISEVEMMEDGSLKVKDFMKKYSFNAKDNAIAALSFATEEGKLLFKAIKQGLKVRAVLTFRAKAYRDSKSVEKYSLYKDAFEDGAGVSTNVKPYMNVEIKHCTYLKLTKYTFREESRMNFENEIDV